LVTPDVNVVVTREAGKNGELRSWLPPDATVLEVPLTRTTYLDGDDVRAALDASPYTGEYRSLVVTSERSVAYVDDGLRVSAPDVEVYSVGPRTSLALSTHHVSSVPGEGSAASLAQHIVQGPVLILGATTMREELPDALRDKGLEVVMIACYETVGLSLTTSDVEALRGAGAIVIGAPSAWAVAREHVSKDTWVVVPGESTAAAVRIDHARVLEGWGPDLRTRLAELPT
jgi:uroporphyrinogen-III synthase